MLKVPMRQGGEEDEISYSAGEKTFGFSMLVSYHAILVLRMVYCTGSLSECEK